MAERSVKLHPEAERDIEEGLAFYAKTSLIAAERFLDEVDSSLALIAEAPNRWPVYRAGTRHYVMAAFPYSIVYRATAGEIQVFAVAHGKRRPTFWRARRF